MTPQINMDGISAAVAGFVETQLASVRGILEGKDGRKVAGEVVIVHPDASFEIVDEPLPTRESEERLFKRVLCSPVVKRHSEEGKPSEEFCYTVVTAKKPPEGAAANLIACAILGETVRGDAFIFADLFGPYTADQEENEDE